MLTALLLTFTAAVPAHTCGLARTDAFALEPLYGAAAASDGRHAYVFGGQGSSKQTRDLLVFDAATPRPKRSVVKGATARRYHAIAVREPWLYVLGGEGDGRLAPAERIHLDSLAVEQLSPLPVPRLFVSAAWHDGKLYVAGGETAQGRSARVDVYDADTGGWSEGPPLAEARDTKLVDVDGTLYAVGGYRGDNVASAMVERLAPGARSWERAADLPVATSAHAAVALGGKLYALGDYTELGRLLVLDVATERWSAAPSSFLPRRHAAATTLGDAVLLVGGNVRSKGPGTRMVERFVPACANVAPAPTCLALRDQAGDGAGALAEVRTLCGAVPDLDRRLASAALADGDRAAGLRHLERALTSASASPASLALVGSLAKKGLSAEERAAFGVLGRDVARPLYVPSVDAEYRWMRSFACPPGQKAKRARQALRKDQLDVLEIECAGKAAGSLYFDFETLPEQAQP
ncbi:MAG: hypothetical protein HYS27_10830 [Deltaproteobacteria bacterium]|nr:hypothetical protein [Deltaproteobacteria bacterium]